MPYSAIEESRTTYHTQEGAIARPVSQKQGSGFTLEFYTQPWQKLPEENLKMLVEHFQGCDRQISQAAQILANGYDDRIERDLISAEAMRDRLVEKFKRLSAEVLQNMRQEAIALNQ